VHKNHKTIEFGKTACRQGESMQKESPAEGERKTEKNGAEDAPKILPPQGGEFH
jgi:hypothetical protein